MKTFSAITISLVGLIVCNSCTSSGVSRDAYTGKSVPNAHIGDIPTNAPAPSGKVMFSFGMSLAQGSDLAPITIPADKEFRFTFDKAVLDPSKTLRRGGFVAPVAGWYLIVGHANFVNLLDSGSVALFLCINGQRDTSTLAGLPMASNSNPGAELEGTRFICLKAGDFVQLCAIDYSNGTSRNIQSIPSTQWGRDLQTTLSGYSLP